jgi:hypothetical protein
VNFFFVIPAIKAAVPIPSLMFSKPVAMTKVQGTLCQIKERVQSLLWILPEGHRIPRVIVYPEP